MEEVGAVSQRAAVGHRPRGLQRRTATPGTTSRTTRPVPRLPLGRGRPGRHLRRQAAALLRPGAVERARPDPQGAAVRPDQQRGQPRRGRQGVLLLPRQHADALVHEVPLQVPAGGLSLRRPGRDQPAAQPRTSSEYELLDTGVFDEDRYFDVFVEYAKATPDDILIQITRRQPRPEAAALHVLPTSGFATPGPGTARPEQPVPAGAIDEAARHDGDRSATHPKLGRLALPATATAVPTLLFTENETNTAAGLRQAEPPARTSRTASTTTSSHGQQRAVNPDQTGTKAAAHYRLDVGPARPARVACA